MRLVQGVGINDAGYAVTRQETFMGKRKTIWRCPYYVTWLNMLTRCYSRKFIETRPNYTECEVSPEWHIFSVFRSWMMAQEWKGMCLDKDLLVPGNKLYGPDTCCFVSVLVNTFITDSAAIRGDWPIGVSWSVERGVFQAQCQNPFTGKNEHLGRFKNPSDANKAWGARKLELAKEIAGIQSDSRIATALISRYEQAKP